MSQLEEMGFTKVQISSAWKELALRKHENSSLYGGPAATPVGQTEILEWLLNHGIEPQATSGVSGGTTAHLSPSLQSPGGNSQNPAADYPYYVIRR